MPDARSPAIQTELIDCVSRRSTSVGRLPAGLARGRNDARVHEDRDVGLGEPLPVRSEFDNAGNHGETSDCGADA